MGKLADAMRGVAMPEQKRQKMLSFDEELVQAQAEMQSLKAENQHLRAQVNPLQREVDQLKDRLRKAEEQKPDALTFNRHTGLHADAAGKLYCSPCYLNGGKRNPVQEKNHGWKCMACGHFFSNPDWKPREPSGGGGPDSWMGR